MRTPPAIVFDLDGTLIDSAPGIRHCLAATLIEWGRDPERELPDDLIGPPLAETFESLGFAGHELEAVVDTYRGHYAILGVSECTTYPGVQELLDEASQRGLALGVATSKFEPYARQILERLGLAPYFTSVRGDTRESRRNKADIARLVLDEVGVPPAPEVWMVGDRRYDVVAARELGLLSVGALWGYGSREELSAAGAVVLAESAGEVLSRLRLT